MWYVGLEPTIHLDMLRSILRRAAIGALCGPEGARKRARTLRHAIEVRNPNLEVRLLGARGRVR